MGIAPERIQTVGVGDRAVPVRAATAAESDVTADVVYASHSGDAVGYVFRVGGRGKGENAGHRPLRVYVTGDTLYDAQLVSDVTRVCVCINGRLGNMTHEEAARLAGELSAGTVIPMHYGVMLRTTPLSATVPGCPGVAGDPTPRVLGIGETLVIGQ